MSDLPSAVEENLNTDSSKTSSNKPSLVDVYFLAMTIALGGQYYQWNDAFSVDFWPAMLLLFLNGIGYLCFAGCMAEMAATLPFSGGIYGFVRAFVGPLCGYIVSRFEILMIICYVASVVQWIGMFPTQAGVSSREMEPLWWLLYYGVCTSIALLGCDYKEYWMFIRVAGGLSLLLLLVYVFGSLPSVNYTKYVENKSLHDFGHFEDCFKLAGMFRGLQYLPLASAKVKNAKEDISRGLFLAMITLLVVAFAVIFTTCSQTPGAERIAEVDLPLTNGFSTMFNIPYHQAIWLSFPGTFASFYGFVWSYGCQLSAMAQSGLLPAALGQMTNSTDTPYVALIVGGVLSYGVALACHWDTTFYPTLTLDVSQTYRLSMYVIYMFFFLSYVCFKRNYTSLPRAYVSPFGIFGACLGFIIFGANAMGTVTAAGDDNAALLVLGFLSMLTIVYYYCFVHHAQLFSAEEKEQLFKAYLINANAKTRRTKKKGGGRGGAGGRGGGRGGRGRGNREDGPSTSSSISPARSSVRRIDNAATTTRRVPLLSSPSITTQDGGGLTTLQSVGGSVSTSVTTRRVVMAPHHPPLNALLPSSQPTNPVKVLPEEITKPSFKVHTLQGCEPVCRVDTEWDHDYHGTGHGSVDVDEEEGGGGRDVEGDGGMMGYAADYEGYAGQAGGMVEEEEGEEDDEDVPQVSLVGQLLQQAVSVFSSTKSNAIAPANSELSFRQVEKQLMGLI